MQTTGTSMDISNPNRLSGPEPNMFLQMAQKCEKLASTCVSKNNRDFLLEVAGVWRKIAEENAADSSSLSRLPPTRCH